MASSAPVMTDVARLAGVSHQTVSRVVNGSPNVSGRTRERVLAAMEQLGYRRNAAARALATRRSGTLGVITFDAVRYGPVSTLYAVEQAAVAVGMGIAIAVINQGEIEGVSVEAVVSAIGRLQDQSVEGVVAIAPQRDALLALTTELRATPTVFVGGADERVAAPVSGVPIVAVDQFGGAVSAVRHLLDLGHPTVHHLAGPENWTDAYARREGWASALRAAGARQPEPVAGDWSASSGYSAMRAVLAADREVSAVFAANDQMALGALRALREAGLRVPTDVSVVGFDDLPESAFFGPPLTTVRQPFAETGRRAVHRLLGLIRPAPVAVGADARQQGAGDPPVGTELVVRDSTARVS